MSFSRRFLGLGALVKADVPSRLLPWANPQASAAAAPQLAGNSAAPASSQPGKEWMALLANAQTAETLFKNYGGKSLAQPNSPQYDIGPPWIDPPAGHRDINNPGIITTPTNSGVDVVVQTYTVPPGHDGVITEIANFYTGPGVVLGTGYLTWRILRNGQAIKNFDAIQVPFGSYIAGGGVQTFRLAAGIRVFAGDVITYVVNHGSSSTLPVAGSSIITFLKGWLYPKGN